jgi:hypothetical protein
MAAQKLVKKSKYKANYSGFNSEKLVLWGFEFTKDGDDYVAELNDDEAHDLLKADKLIKC